MNVFMNMQQLTIEQVIAYTVHPDYRNLLLQEPTMAMLTELLNILSNQQNSRAHNFICRFLLSFFTMHKVKEATYYSKMYSQAEHQLKSLKEVPDDLSNQIKQMENKLQLLQQELQLKSKASSELDTILNKSHETISHLDLQRNVLSRELSELKKSLQDEEQKLKTATSPKEILKNQRAYEVLRSMHSKIKKASKQLYQEHINFIEAIHVRLTSLEKLEQLRKFSVPQKFDSVTFVRLPEAAKKYLTHEEQEIIELRPSVTGNPEVDTEVLQIYSKFTCLTNMRVASWYRANLSRMYHGHFPTKFNISLKFWQTYVNPFNCKTLEEEQEYLALTEEQRRIKYFDLYRTFDLETGNCISMYKSSKVSVGQYGNITR